RKQLQKAPSWIQKLLKASQIDYGIDLKDVIPTFVTEKIRHELDTKGYTVIPNILNEQFVSEAKRYIEIKQDSENIDAGSYKKLCKNRFATGLVTKWGYFIFKMFIYF